MIKLNTGKQEFVLNFDGEHTEKIYFNPCDPALLVRISNVCKEAGEEVKLLDDVELDEAGNPVGSSFVENFSKLLDIIYAGLDKAFGGEISETVFKYCSPFARVGTGDYFFSAFIEAIIPEINKRIEKNKKPTSKDIVDKYVK